MQERRSSVQLLALGLTLAAALLRLVPHPPNFAPVGALFLFAGARFKGWQAYLVPLLAMLVTDPILSHMAGYPAYSSATLVIYGSLVIYALLGRLSLQRSPGMAAVPAVALVGSIQFFLITNLAVWVGAPTLYPHTCAGLALCYTAALPFFGYTATADVFYSVVMFSAFALLARRLSVSNRSSAAY